ncbi:hypothetical protein NDU88_002352 [Pleurodeles waltl]|uniref:Uncharacterized protein n=1 Tax=Pleurodeles waltl TaxID=8319 RepID=A0AAV7UXC4_PLEWA|nr:hypothetical protein NDU88_002352 [Pleurodeles waltl]
MLQAEAAQPSATPVGTPSETKPGGRGDRGGEIPRRSCGPSHPAPGSGARRPAAAAQCALTLHSGAGSRRRRHPEHRGGTDSSRSPQHRRDLASTAALPGTSLRTPPASPAGSLSTLPASPASLPERPACITGSAARPTAPGSGACPQRCQEAPTPPVPQSLPDRSHWISGEDLIFAGARPPKPRKGNFFLHLKLRARGEWWESPARSSVSKTGALCPRGRGRPGCGRWTRDLLEPLSSNSRLVKGHLL